MNGFSFAVRVGGGGQSSGGGGGRFMLLSDETSDSTPLPSPSPPVPSSTVPPEVTVPPVTPPPFTPPPPSPTPTPYPTKPPQDVLYANIYDYENDVTAYGVYVTWQGQAVQECLEKIHNDFQIVTAIMIVVVAFVFVKWIVGSFFGW